MLIRYGVNNTIGVLVLLFSCFAINGMSEIDDSLKLFMHRCDVDQRRDYHGDGHARRCIDDLYEKDAKRGAAPRTLSGVFQLLMRPIPIILKGHTGAVCSTQFSFDGKLLVSTAQDGTVRLWDTASGEEVLCVESPVEGYADYAWITKDGERIVARDTKQKVRGGYMGHKWAYDSVTGEVSEFRASDGIPPKYSNQYYENNHLRFDADPDTNDNHSIALMDFSRDLRLDLSCISEQHLLQRHNVIVGLYFAFRGGYYKPSRKERGLIASLLRQLPRQQRDNFKQYVPINSKKSMRRARKRN